VIRRLLHAFAFIVGVLACAYVAVVMFVGSMAVEQWWRRGVPQRALWVGLSAAAMLVPGIVIAGLCVWYLRSQRRLIEPGQGFDVLPPR
jgi:ABC-type spermidine/putrescine transport system permease subunit II